MDARSPAAGPALDQWNEQLSTRRFCWAVLHRLRGSVGPAEPQVPPTEAKAAELAAEAAAAIGTARTFDMYYVTLRRPQSTNRYARQEVDERLLPNPYVFDRNEPPVVPAAMKAENDVMFPVPWRVQVQFPPPPTLLASKTATDPARRPTGVPTEIQVPPGTLPTESAVMLVQMFPTGTRFVEEITGDIYRVVKRRVTGDSGEKAFLTLDREVTVEDLDLPASDPRCELCGPVDPDNPYADPEELLRTIWVFPPPASPERSRDTIPVFDGSSPVVNIDVRTVSLAPSS
jgi:hypothetical protein